MTHRRTERTAPRWAGMATANLTKTIEARYSGKMIIEVLAGLDSGGRPSRILRLTADQSPFHNKSGSSLITNSGQFYFRGAGYAYVTVDGTMTNTGDSSALTNLILNFSSQTATVNFRTTTASGDIKVAVSIADLPFNVVTGAFGGAVSV
ncbi:MAG: hypothetical protein EBU97_06920, partial [Rhodobacteraceae bacterium]|nr:hypothetical protein [Paracoccaceae bacterium]